VKPGASQETHREYDPALNSIFLAWDVLVHKYAKEEWPPSKK